MDAVYGNVFDFRTDSIGMVRPTTLYPANCSRTVDYWATYWLPVVASNPAYHLSHLQRYWITVLSLAGNYPSCFMRSRRIYA